MALGFNCMQFLLKEYMPKTRHGLGVGSWNGGSGYYRQCLKWHLSVDMTPEQVSQIGTQEVQRIHTKMTQVSSNSYLLSFEKQSGSLT